MDDSGQMLQLHGGTAGYEIYPYRINTYSSSAYFYYDNIFMRDSSKELYFVSIYGNKYCLGYCQWYGTTDQVLTILSNQDLPSNEAGQKVYGLIPAVDNCGFLTCIAFQRYLCYDTKNGILSEMPSPNVVLLQDFRVYWMTNSKYPDSIYYIARGVASGNYGGIQGGPQTSYPTKVSGAYNNTFYMLKAISATSDGYMYSGYRFDVSSSGINMSSGWFPYSSSSSMHVSFSFFDDTNMYIMLYNNANSRYANKLLIYNMVTNTSNSSSISFTSSYTYMENYHYPIGHVEGTDYIYVLYYTESSNGCVLYRINKVTGAFSLKSLRVCPHGISLKLALGTMDQATYIPLIKESALYSNGSILFRGFIINWDEATIRIGAGIDINDIGVGRNQSDYYQQECDYPRTVRYIKQNMAYGGITHIGQTLTNRDVLVCPLPNDSTLVEVAGKSELRAYYGKM